MSHVLTPIKQALWIEKSPDKALALIQSLETEGTNLSAGDRVCLMEMCGQAHAEKQQYDEATQKFLTINDYYRAGYSQMLKGDLSQAFENWKGIYQKRQNHWAVTLLGLVSGRLNSYPTFLQIRNHLEADVMHLVWAGRLDFVNNLLFYVDVLSDVNYEAFKFVGRGLFHAGQHERAIGFLLKGQKVLPNDPEIYFHLGQYYYAIGQYDEATMVLNQCLLISPVYVPAKDILEKMGRA